MSVTALSNYVQNLEAPVVAGSHKRYFQECGEGRIWNSGIVKEDSFATELARSNSMNASHTFMRRQTDDLSMNIMEVGNDTCPPPSGLEQGLVKWAKFRGNKHWAVDNNHTWAVRCGDEDAFDIIMKDVNNFWVSSGEKYILSMLRGLIAHDEANYPSASTTESLLYDAVAADTAAGGSIGPGINLVHYNNAKNRLSCDRFTGALVHQNVANQMMNEGLLSRDSSGGSSTLYNLAGETNVTVVTDPRLKPLLEVTPNSNDGNYYTVLFKDGMFAYGEGCHPDPLEVDKNPCISNGDGGKSLFSRRQFVLQPATHSFVGLNGEGGGFAKDGGPDFTEVVDPTIYERTVPFDFQSGMFIKSQA